MPAARPLEVRFWEKVNAHRGAASCWLWTGSKDDRGYGMIRVGRSVVRSHIVSWEMAHGPVPDGMCVLHNCPSGDNTSCVNPAHLWLGTRAENNADRDAKGRHRPVRGEAWARAHPAESMKRGSRHWKSSLTEDHVREMREMRSRGATYSSIGLAFGMSTSGAFNAVNNGWTHVPKE